MSKTVVVNVKHEPYDVYIGRAMPGFPASKFANLARVGKDGTRAECIAKHRERVMNDPQLLAQVEELRGMRMGCWCKPKPGQPETEHTACHGDIYVEILEGPPPKKAEQLDLF